MADARDERSPRAGGRDAGLMEAQGRGTGTILDLSRPDAFDSLDVVGWGGELAQGGPWTASLGDSRWGGVQCTRACGEGRCSHAGLGLCHPPPPAASPSLAVAALLAQTTSTHARPFSPADALRALARSWRHWPDTPPPGAVRICRALAAILLAAICISCRPRQRWTGELPSHSIMLPSVPPAANPCQYFLKKTAECRWRRRCSVPLPSEEATIAVATPVGRVAQAPVHTHGLLRRWSRAASHPPPLISPSFCLSFFTMSCLPIQCRNFRGLW